MRVGYVPQPRRGRHWARSRLARWHVAWTGRVRRLHAHAPSTEELHQLRLRTSTIGQPCDTRRVASTHLLLRCHDSQILVGHPQVLLQLRKTWRGNSVELGRQHLRCHRHPGHPRYLTVCHRRALVHRRRCRIARRSSNCLILLLRRLLTARRSVRRHTARHPSHLSQRRVLPNACHRVMSLRSALRVRRRVRHRWRLEGRTTTIHATLRGDWSLVGRHLGHVRCLLGRRTGWSC